MALPMILAFVGTALFHGAAPRAPKQSPWQKWAGSHQGLARVTAALLWTLGLALATAVHGPGVALAVVGTTTMLALPLLSLTVPWWPTWTFRGAPIAVTGAAFVVLWGLL